MTREMRDSGSDGVSRRTFLKGAGLTVASVGAAGAAGASVGSIAGAVTQDTVPIVGPGQVQMTFMVNGGRQQVAVEPWVTLLDMLRDRLDLTGTKRVCDRGGCSGCSVLVDGKPMNSCSFLAIDAQGKEITTIEGLADGDLLTPIQEAFVECDALQCGFCTPGMLIACTALLKRNPDPSRADVADAISGNLCRCGTYANIFEAVEKAKGVRRARF